MDRVFLDANILFSAAYREDAGLVRLWKLAGLELVTSGYAIEAARRNLSKEDARGRLNNLLKTVAQVGEAVDRPLSEEVALPLKDRPILLAAIDAHCRYLLTGDITHFGPYFGRTIEGVKILRPADFLRNRTR